MGLLTLHFLLLIGLLFGVVMQFAVGLVCLDLDLFIGLRFWFLVWSVWTGCFDVCLVLLVFSWVDGFGFTYLSWFVMILIWRLVGFVTMVFASLLWIVIVCYFLFCRWRCSSCDVLVGLLLTVSWFACWLILMFMMICVSLFAWLIGSLNLLWFCYCF